MDFAESEEHRALRAAVAEIAGDYGPRYYAERAAAHRPCTELWKALGEAGFIGVNIGEAYGGGGGGLTELVLVCEEIAAAATRIRSFRPGSRRRAGRPAAPRAPGRDEADVACAAI